MSPVAARTMRSARSTKRLGPAERIADLVTFIGAARTIKVRIGGERKYVVIRGLPSKIPNHAPFSFAARPRRAPLGGGFCCLIAPPDRRGGRGRAGRRH